MSKTLKGWHTLCMLNNKTITMTQDKYLSWYRSSDTGTSSETMFEVLTGIPAKFHDRPHDMADIGRCIRMLRLFPELRPLIGNVQKKYIAWRPYIDCWMELERLYEKCVEFENLAHEEQKKLKKKKSFNNPLEQSWQLCQRLDLVSRYLVGQRMQGSSSCFSHKEPENF